MAWSSFKEILRWRAAHQRDRRAYGEWADGGVTSWITYGELDRRARAIAAALEQKVAPGERALLLYPPGFDYLAAFFGCLYAGVVAVPAYPPEPMKLDRQLPRLRAILADAQAGALLTTSRILALGGAIGAQAPELGRLAWIATDALDGADQWREQHVAPETLAFLQYTSGSTGMPKGVRLTHRNLLHNSAAIQIAHEYTPESRMVSWLPPYHDMGLIGGLLQPMYTGFPCVLMSPVSFLLRPQRWLEAISWFRATSSGGPNFAFDLCARKATDEQVRALDLSSWDLAFSGAEPVRRDTLDRFAQKLAPAGFKPSAFYPCYGLAEATLIVTGVEKGRYRAQESRAPGETVGLGRSVTGGEVLIVDPERRERVADGEVGEIWVRSTSVAEGYWNRPEATQETFGARLSDGDGPFLRTGDLGRTAGGELYVTGRIKEILIVRGRKHYPTDLEATLEAAHWNTSQFRAGGSAAFAVELDGEERLFLAIEVERRQRERRAAHKGGPERRRGGDRRRRPFAYQPGGERTPLAAEELIRSARNAIAAAHGVEVFGVVLVRPGAIPKTTSGKKQRLACRGLFLDERSRDVLHEWRADQSAAAPRRARVA